ncbi:MAG: hypothetical protein K1X72_26930 [Pyrinomonadaceae bacterium]|nr:hypothetical protein [Pyrinomonadaceae bacterium]
MKKIIFLNLFVLILLTSQSIAQKQFTPTEEVKILGKVKSEITIKASDFKSFLQQKIKDVKILNYRGEDKGTLKKLRGIPIVELLKKIEFEVDNERFLSEFYLIFEASDGYKVVFSWNEIFNSDVGKNTFIVTQKDGQTDEKIGERIILLTPNDYKTGRRYVKNLAKIIVKRIE